MKLLLEADLSTSLAHALRTRGHDVREVREVMPPATPDRVVYQRAVDEQRILMTRDLFKEP